jgi:hypothetical protein
MKHIKTIVIALSLVTAAACGKDKEGGGSGGGGGAAKTTEASGPLAMSAKDLWDDYGKHDGMKLLERYKNGVTVTGKIKSIGGDPADTTTPLSLMLDVDGSAKIITLGFTDEGAAARSKKAGEEVSATCKDVLGQSGNMMQLDGCALK